MALWIQKEESKIKGVLDLVLGDGVSPWVTAQDS